MVREIGSSVDYRKLTSVRDFASLSDCLSFVAM